MLSRPMLAKTYGDGPSCQYKPGMLVQPKLNGIRALYHNGTFVSPSLIRGHAVMDDGTEVGTDTVVTRPVVSRKAARQTARTFVLHS